MMKMEADTAVLSRWLTGWASTYDPSSPMTPTVLEGEAYQEPSLMALASDAEVEDLIAVSWARLSIRDLLAEQWTLGQPGNRQFRRRATLYIQLFTPPDRGTAAATALATTAQALYEGESFDGVDIVSALTRQIGTDGRWYQTNVEVTFDYYDQK